MEYELQQLESMFTPKFRAKQLFSWIYTKRVDDFEQMQNLPKDFRAELEQKFRLWPLKIAQKQISSDGTVKYLFELIDGHTIESVLLKMSDEELDDDGEVVASANYTLCLSTQVGCKIGCAFCLTAKSGFVRNLTAGEIVAQALIIEKDISLAPNKSVNIVYMGMGEPLDNLEHLIGAIKIFSDTNGMSIHPKRQTVSTSGLTGKIEKLSELDLGVNLAISLHAVDDKIRDTLIPLNKAHNIESILSAVRKFPVNRRKKILFEYLLLGEINDDIESAKKLAKLLNGIDAKVNLIPFNSFENSGFKAPKNKTVDEFKNFLQHKGIIATVRKSRGSDISAACGQLKEQAKKEGNSGR